MKKKFLSILCLSLIAGMMASCGGDKGGEKEQKEESHVHTFATEWSYDNNTHWHAATCEHTNEKDSVDVHAYGSDDTCDVCGFTREHIHTFSSDWSFDETGHWHASTCGHDVKDDFNEHDFSKGDTCICGYTRTSPEPVDPIYSLSINETIEKSFSEEETQWELLEVTIEVGDILTVYNIAVTPKEPLTGLTIGGEDKCGFTAEGGVLTASKGGIFSFYLKPAFENDVIYIAEKVEEHTHTFSEDWTYDETGHWHAATCEHSEEKSEYAEHDFGEGYRCMCGYEKEPDPIYILTVKSGITERSLDFTWVEKESQWVLETVDIFVGDKLVVSNGAKIPPQPLTSLSIGGEDKCGFTEEGGVLTSSKEGAFSFYLKPAFENDVIYIADNTPIPPAVYSYVINEDPAVSIGEAIEGVLYVSGVTLNEGDTVFFENTTADPAEPLTKLTLTNGENYGLSIENGIITATLKGTYEFKITLEMDNDKIEVIRASIASPYHGSVFAGGELFADNPFRFSKVNKAENYIEYKITYVEVPAIPMAGVITLQVTVDGEPQAVTIEQAGTYADFSLSGDGKTLSNVITIGSYFNFYIKEDLTTHALTLYIESACSEYSLLIGDKTYDLYKNETPLDPSFQEWFTNYGVEVKAGDEVAVRHTTIEEGKTVHTDFSILTVDPASVEGFKVADDKLICETEGTYKFYLKLKWQQDQLYIGPNN